MGCVGVVLWWYPTDPPFPPLNIRVYLPLLINPVPLSLASIITLEWDSPSSTGGQLYPHHLPNTSLQVIVTVETTSVTVETTSAQITVSNGYSHHGDHLSTDNYRCDEGLLPLDVRTSTCTDVGGRGEWVENPGSLVCRESPR